MQISDTIKTLKNITGQYRLKALYLDYTDTTLISRIGVSFDVFIQVYVNIKKEKLNLALIVAEERIYGVDKEGGFYHEHPFENPLLYIDTEEMCIEDFVIKSLGILKNINLI